MSFITALVLSVSVASGLPAICYEAPNLLEASAEALPIWRGFNLQEKFILEWPSSGPFHEEDFRLISELGFNFVRLPMDYRFWIMDGDWEQINEDAFADLDQAIEFGAKYGIHVCMNFHRAPGHTVASPPEATNLWRDAETQRVCAMHWQYFAKRYKGVPNCLLSFNLFNEPHGIGRSTYAAVVKIMVDAIRSEDPDRLIIADGVEWGMFPCENLVPLGIAQATRGYQPSSVSHYLASWVEGADKWAPPSWPVRSVGGGFLYGAAKKKIGSLLEIDTDHTTPLVLTVTVGDVSTHARLAFKMDGEELYTETFTPGEGEGPWQKSIFHPQYNCFQATYDKAVSVTIPPGDHQVTLEITEGDWLSLTRIAVGDGETEYDAIGVVPQWGRKNRGITVSPETGMLETRNKQDAQWLWGTYFSKWAALKDTGIGVMVGEWGAFSKTPHDITLRWMEDNLKTFQRVGLGWALWNFRGAFGILDSGRSDVIYEDFHGHQLDRKMLELLQRY